MKNEKVYATISTNRNFVVRKKGKYLVAVDFDNKEISYGKINIETGKCIGGTNCFDGLMDAFNKTYKQTLKKYKR